METTRNIHDDIRSYIFPDINDTLQLRNGHKASVIGFLDNPLKGDYAKDLFKFIAQIESKESVYGLLDDLQKYEEGFKGIIPNHREHFIHSANVYVLGLAIYNSSQTLRNALITPRPFPGNEHEQKLSFLFRWSLAACLHDMTYPLEMSLKSFNAYATKLHNLEEPASFILIHRNLINDINILPVIRSQSEINHLQKDTALGLIANYLTNPSVVNGIPRLGYDTLLDLIKSSIYDNLHLGIIDHGIFSALITLNLIHKLYEDNMNWDNSDFYYEVVDSATAMFLHNWYPHVLSKEQYGYGKFKYFSPSPLGYLLCLCDTMCEWNRGDNRDESKFALEITDDQIVLKVKKGHGSINKLEKALVRIFDNEHLRVILEIF